MTPEQIASSGTESGHQKALFQWAALSGRVELQLMFAIPNGGKRDMITAARMKAEGVKKGVPDIMLPVARGPYHGLFIEMKVGKGRLSPEQESWIERLVAEDYCVHVCYSWTEAKTALENYLDDKG